ncbi:MAG: hypothetical protein CM15mV22_2110 [Eurybiavirus sp.]|nr:MAG: hypothetical protein CM15mV22_2110 [Eurybiavirus sp.]
MTTSSTTINLTKVWYDVSQKYGFPDEAEVLIPSIILLKGIGVRREFSMVQRV